MLLEQTEIWLVAGSQRMYGDEALRDVQAHVRALGAALDQSSQIPTRVIVKDVASSESEVTRLCHEANSSAKCAGLILWMHTFSPAKMWIRGLSQIQRPVCHLHTQFNRDLPWDSIDMEFMNLNQSAHGDREAGHLHARLNLRRKVVVGHWSDEGVLTELGDWARIAGAWGDMQSTRIARFGDNMRNVAVTEGDKVAAQMQFGFEVDGFGVGELVKSIADVEDAQVDQLVERYLDSYEAASDLRPSGSRHKSLRESARQEIGIKRFLDAGSFTGFTTNFEDLHGLEQLPGVAVQSLMQQGYGFGAEGDWKSAALLRFFKVASEGLEGGSSFMEDYTYHLEPGRELVLGAHMLEICPSIAASKPRLDIHPLSIGGKADPVRLVFDARPGPAINVSLTDLGSRFRMVASAVDVESAPPMPKLPVARALWKCRPDFKTSAAAWIYAGGSHHTIFSQALSSRHMRTFGEMAGIETLVIDESTQLLEFQKELRWNAAYFTGRAPFSFCRG